MSISKTQILDSFVPPSSNPSSLEDQKALLSAFNHTYPSLEISAILNQDVAEDIWEATVETFSEEIDNLSAYVEAGQLVAIHEPDLTSIADRAIARQDALTIVQAVRQLFSQHYAKHCASFQ